MQTGLSLSIHSSVQPSNQRPFIEFSEDFTKLVILFCNSIQCSHCTVYFCIVWTFIFQDRTGPTTDICSVPLHRRPSPSCLLQAPPPPFPLRAHQRLTVNHSGGWQPGKNFCCTTLKAESSSSVCILPQSLTPWCASHRTVESISVYFDLLFYKCYFSLKPEDINI